jgi:S-adenosylmethionine uptake transporter
MIWLSAGSNLLLYSILRALKFVDISLLAPFRFIELIIAAIVGYLFFRELPSNDLIIGSIVTFISAGFLGWIEIKMANNSNNNA